MFKFRKVFTNGPLRTNLTGKSAGMSVGFPGFRYGISANGRHYVTVSIPGTGLSYTKYLDGKKG